ncbi:ABC transporter permease [Enterococcus sp. DIV0800]|uniref:ABC transporter permease n=1 Tax=unclassified Enterococcus TaxID=2608891 RepID=UPI003D2FDF1B
MRNLIYFTKKELFESWRTYRLLILLIVFLILGLMNPLMAKLTPEIFKMTIGKSLAQTIPEPTSLDSWTQFYKNMTQIGLVVFALMFSGTVSNEVNQGTLINLVTKGLHRWTVIIGKLISLIFQWSLCLVLSFLITWAYTLYYFPDDKSPYLLQAVFPLWLFGMLLMGLVLFASTVARNSYEGLLITGGGVVILGLLNLFDQVKKYNPISLTTENLDFLQKAELFQDYLSAMIISCLLFVLLIILSILLFNKKRL